MISEPATVGTARKLGEQERLFHYLHAYGGLIPTQVMHIRGRLDPALVRRALNWLQQRYPLMQAHIRYGELVFRGKAPYLYRQPYFDTVGTTEIPLRVITDPDPDAWEKVLEVELKKSMPRGKNPRIRAVLVRASEDADLSHFFLTPDHAISDAPATNMASRDFMDFLADPEAAMAKPPSQLPTMPQPLEFGYPKRSDSGTKGYEPAIRLPKAKVPGGKQVSRRIERRLEPETLAALKPMLKAKKTTLHGALTAAFLTAMREKYGIDEMTNLSTFDMRRLSKPPFPTSTYGCYIDLLRTRHTITDDFWAVAQDVSFKVITTVAKDLESASIMKLWGMDVYRKEFWPTATNNRRIDGLAMTTADASNLGEDYGPFKLEHVTMAVSSVMFGSSFFVVSSERLGALDFYICYADYALPKADADEVTDRALAVIRRAVVV